MNQKRPLGYLGGDIMTRGSNLAREEEYQKFIEAGIPGEVYGLDPKLTEQIARLYVTHPGVTVDGIMTKMGL